MNRQAILDQAKVGGWAIVRQEICSVNPKNDSLILGLKNHDGEKLVFREQVLSIEPPPETDAEKIARLEARVKELEAEKSALCQANINIRRSAEIQREAYDNWARGAELVTGTTRFDMPPYYKTKS